MLGDVLRTEGGPQAAELRAAAEELTAGTHEFEEVRLLDASAPGWSSSPPDKLAELDQLLGGSGHDPASRLGLEPEATTPSSSGRRPWRHWAAGSASPSTRCPAGRPSSPPRTATRTLEGLLAAHALTRVPLSTPPRWPRTYVR